jgi:hypothetical protein
MCIIGLTIKNKFSILLTNELLNELNGSKYFSKVDLRLGYYQARIYVEDIEKTTFRIHHRYYEFKVIPFNLTNTLTTFQALMNSVLKILFGEICVNVFRKHLDI